MTDALIIERSDGVATLILNRPESMNSLSLELKEALVDTVPQIAADDSVRAVVLTGAGRAFCVGQDLREHHALLVVAAVNGVAAGAGAGFAFACDFRIASKSASFLLAFANVGLSLDSGASWTLPRLIGSARATALSLLAEPVTADAALDMGLVNAVVEPERVLPAAHELAARLAAGPTLAYASIKESIAFAATSTLGEALAKEAEMQARTGASGDHRSSVAAFVNKQKPAFTGH